MRRFVRSSAAAILVLLLLSTLSSVSHAVADDYRVDFGAETDRGRDAGTIDCRFDRSCHAELKSLGFSVYVRIRRGDASRLAHVSLSGYELGCCYFADASDSITVPSSNSPSRVPLFKGMRARGALFIENQRVGTLYLRFHFR